jgi:hypothetical protein
VIEFYQKCIIISMTEVGDGDDKPVGTDKVVVTPDVKISTLRQIYFDTGVGFPVDADESRRQGGTSVRVDDSHADKGKKSGDTPS